MHAIDILRTVREAFGFTNRQFATWISVALIPVLLNAGVIAGFYVVGEGQPAGMFANFLRNILTLAIDVPFLAAWHRMTLLGPGNARGVIGYSYRGAERRFLGFLLLAYLFFLVGSLVGGLIIAQSTVAGGGDQGTVLLAIILSLALTIALVIVILRWSMVFPAAAVGERLGFAGSWQLTRGNGWRVFAIFICIALPYMLVGVAVVLALGLKFSLGSGYAAVELLLLIPGFYFAAVTVSALSMIYWNLTGYDPSTFRIEAIMKR